MLKGRVLAQVFDLIAGEPQGRQIVQSLFQPGYNQMRAPRRKRAHEQIEDSSSALEAVLKVRGGHREFVKIGRKSESALDSTFPMICLTTPNIGCTRCWKRMARIPRIADTMP